MLTLSLSKMQPTLRRRAKRVGIVQGDEVRLTFAQYEYVQAGIGLGDVVERALAAVGIAALVKRRWPHCGCARRKAALNRFGSRVSQVVKRAFKGS